MGRARGVLQALALVLGGLLVPLVALEVALRIAGTSRAVELGPDFDRPDSLFVWQPPRANPWLRANPGREPFRIAVIGDSFTVGQGVRWDDAYPARLERWLNFNAGVPPVDVLVYARLGTSTRDQLRFFQEALDEEPDLLLLGLFLNDPERHSDPMLGVWRERMVPRAATGALGTLTRVSRATAWIWTRWERFRAARAGERYYRFLYSPENSGWQPFVEALGIFAEGSRRAGVPLAVVIFPGMGTLGPDYPHRFAHQRLHEVLDPLEVPYLDLLPVFADKNPTRMAVLPGVDHHPSEIAHRLAAETILAWLFEEKLVPAVYRPRAREDGQHDEWRRVVERLSTAPEEPGSAP
ncbi:MAG: GDSL-type esterase/lipase family protein [Thermoanaerobaculia bacterium]